jgi:hypothetical protein
LIGVGFADAVARLANGCFQLYQFWETLQEAPAAVQVIKDELMLLAGLLQPIADEPDLMPPVILILNACYGKVQVSMPLSLDYSAESFTRG